jgi:transposase-like protein
MRLLEKLFPCGLLPRLDRGCRPCWLEAHRCLKTAYLLLAGVLENQGVDDEEAIVDEVMETLKEATHRLRATKNRLWATGTENKPNYRDLAHRVSTALAMTEAAYLEARRRAGHRNT